MKYIVSCHQPLNYLKTSNVIKVDYKDFGILSYLIDKDQTFDGEVFLYVKNFNEINWDKLNIYKDILNISIGFEEFTDFDLRDPDYKIFWSFPITSYWELNRITHMGVSQVILGAPLYFDVKHIKEKYNVDIQLCANECFNPYIPCENGVRGTYIRPEDIEVYEPYVSYINFAVDNLQKERTLVKIYEMREWKGNLNLLLNNLNYDIDNRAILGTEFAEVRMQCKQKCQDNRVCNYCQTTFDIITMIDQNLNWLKEQTD